MSALSRSTVDTRQSPFRREYTWTMSKTLTRCLFLLSWILSLDCEVYQNRPKIKTSDGDLILEAAFDKSIYLLPNGPKSSIYVGEVNILKNNAHTSSGQSVPANNEDFNKYLNGPDGLLQRIQRLEDSSSVSNELSVNISVVWRHINRLNRRITRLQLQLSTRNRDECQSQPCQHGGTCLNLVNGYHCLCPNNWEGKDCDVDVDECRNYAGTDLGCQNGATCINRPGFYECSCSSGWFGVHCTKKTKNCSGGDFAMCAFGTCIESAAGGGIRCICEQGWTTNGTGTPCLTDINECEASQGPRCSVNPKVDCINLPGSFRCGQCPPGYEGDGYSCSDINECVVLPNGGCSPMVTCHNTIGSRICGSCPPGYQGDGITCTWRGSCNINHGGCHPSAQCIENGGLGGAQCICPEGTEGDGIGLHGCVVTTGGNFTQGCENNPCGSHGQCHELRTGYTCICYRGYSGAHCEVTSNMCAVNPCFNGGICKADNTITRGFRCECTSQYSGPLCQLLIRSCGGVLDNEEGSIVYPETNTTYNHNARCAWVIRTVPDKVINITFSKFNLESSSECMYDFLQIHDGRSSASQLIGRFCGNDFPKGGNIISSHNNLYFWFRSDGTVAKNGFALHWTSINPVCGGEIDATTHGHITSPGSPGKYPPNRDCYWHLRTTLGKRIQLHFFGLDIEAHNNCSFDYLEIFDGERSSDPLLNRYCNSTQPAPIHSAGSEMLIHFHSDAYGSGNGFQIAYAPTEGVPGCGGFFTADRGEIFSPSYNGSYLENLQCEYEIKTSPETRIKIVFQSFNLEKSFRCKFDYLKIYDGPSANSQLVGKFCGTTYPKSYVSTSNTLFFKFKSDRSISSEGFRILYETVCQINVQGDSGIIKSPGYPFNYPDNRVCEYIISAAPGKSIQLTFQDFDIEDNQYYNCRYDNVQIYDGPDSNSTILGTYCGGPEHTPPMQTSTYNYLYIKFVSDLSVSGTGFYANYTTIDTECGGIYRATTGLINHPSKSTETYKNDQKCTWLLKAPEGLHIKLTWNRFDLESMTDCQSDFIELIEIDENNEQTSMGKYCGTKAPPALTISSNQLMIKFESDSSVRSSGFSLSYAFLDEKTHCGGMYIKSHGYIYSPGWPKSYEPNRDCTWIIEVPKGQQIKLNISQFDLERPIRDKCNLGDYLEIRNGGTESSPLIGQFCGKFESRRILSMTNSLHLHFHSDFYLTGKGFKIEWDGSITGCGGTMTSSTGSITSPNYPNNYHENAECFYKIIVNSGSRIRISFRELDLERTFKCKDDYVILYDGRDSSANSLGKYCVMSPKLSSIETSSNYAFIKFRSDFYLSGRGFYLNYNAICQNNITGTYGVIESPDHPNNSPQHLDCLWNIHVPKGNKINVTFTHFNVKRSYRSRYWQHRGRATSQCDTDYLQTKELSDTEFSSKMCGIMPSHTLSTKTNSLQIKYVTGSLPWTGFRLEWISYGCGGHLQKDFGDVTLDRSSTSAGEMECEWLIETSFGKAVYLYFIDLYMMDSTNCTTDAIEIYNGKDTQSPLLSKICHREKAWVQSTSNFMLVRFVKQSTLKDIFFQARFSSPRVTCGGHMEAFSGFIYSKNYPMNYDDNLDCMWLISVPRYHRIELSFIDFDLYYSPYYDEHNADAVLCGDHIKIYDNINLNYTHKICPTTNVTKIITPRNRVNIQFISNSHGSAKGFKIGFKAVCGSVINAVTEGVIQNDIDSHTSSCTWTIVADKPDQKISLTITHLSFQGAINGTCSASYIRIYNGDDKDAPLLNEYCGRKIPPMLVSEGSAITLELGTYGNNIEGRFSAHYSPLSSACGGTFTSEEGTIASPNYPRPYPAAANCEWILQTSPGNRVYITFERFDIESSEGCNEDYLEVRENSGGGTLLGVYCGNDIPTNTTAATKLYIKFHSNTQNNGGGFLIHYGFLHGNEITGNSGEVASPLYPYPYHGSAEYSWRITTLGTKAISVTVDRMEIRSYGDVCYNKLSIYDGYDESAHLMNEFCGVLGTEPTILQTTSNAVYIKLFMDESNTGSMFHLTWVNVDKGTDETDSSNKINCGSNETEIISPGGSKELTSPHYPNEYDNELKCEWIFKATPGHHLRIHFDDFKIEETSGCFADHVTIYKADTFGEWETLKNRVCLSEKINDEIDGSNYLKIVFETDTSITMKGFHATVTSACGGILTDLSGTIGPTWRDIKDREITNINTRCDWFVKVRPGRTIKIQFQHFNISNSAEDCVTSLILHNGASLESPMLGNGKYCGYEHESRDDLITSGNALLVSYVTNHIKHIFGFQNFRIHYEENNIECGLVTKLDSEHSWEVINSPNYPSIPLPYSECIWIISGPPGEIIRIDFIDRFDLDDVDDCATEVVEVRDGSSELSPRLGRFCSDRPGTVKTTNNIAYIRYQTQLAEPRNGFKANVSIDICGGTIFSSSGEISSPGYPHLKVLPYGSVCEWRIIGSRRNTFLLSPQDVNLPESESPCATKLTIEELIPANNTISILKTICEDEGELKYPVIETSTNDVMIKLYIGKPSEWTQISESRGFRLVFNSSKPVCGGLVTTSEGFLTTPSYPLETTLAYCQWYIKVPDKSRSVKLEIMDANYQNHRIGIFNDLQFFSAIQRIPDVNNHIVTNNVFESSGNTMAVYVWLAPQKMRHRFKAKFTSESPALCGGDLNGLKGSLVSPDLERSYTCEWHYNNKAITTDDGLEYNSIYMTVNMNSSVTRSRCRYYDPKLNIKSTGSSTVGLPFTRDICGNTQASYRIPFSALDLKATKSQTNSLSFNLEWKSQPCGGMMEATDTAENILRLPTNYTDSLDCAWIVTVPINNRIKLEMLGSFQLECDEEYLKISQGLSKTSPVIGDFCKSKTLDDPIISNFRYIYVEYHSSAKNSTNIQLTAKTIDDQCGGFLLSYQNVFASPNFPKNYYSNIECTWEIKANWGNRVSLNFIERFVVEDRPNCTKDAVIIYDWNNGKYDEIARLCGRTLPHSYNSTFNRMKVVLRTDADTNLDGFKAIWSPLCGGQYKATEEEQILYSPNYPYEYQPLLDCEYVISGEDQKVIVKFLEFELEGTYPDCEFDNVSISVNSMYDYFYETYCGDKLPPLVSGDSVTINFKTDQYRQVKGFKLSFKLYTCGGHVNASTVITSNEVENYSENLNCTWFIEAPTDKIVVLRLPYIDVEYSSDCSTDYVAVYNGLTLKDDTRLAVLCGNITSSTVIRSTANTLLLQFVTDPSMNSRGFKADVLFTYSTAVGCGGKIDLTTTSSSHTLKSPLIGHNLVYENFLDCQWNIQSPADTYVKIEFLSFHISPCDGVNQTSIGYSKCDCDLVQVLDGLNPNSLVVGTYCGHTLPPPMISSENAMSVRLSTDGEIPSSGFEARLTVQRSVCGQSSYTITEKLQQIKFPGYDSGSVPRGLHCAYQLNLGMDYSFYVIRLRVTVDLQDPENGGVQKNRCTKDKLLITSIPNKINQTIGKDLIIRHPTSDFFYRSNFYDVSMPQHIELCGRKESIDYYIYGDVYLNLFTSSDGDSKNHKGVLVEVMYAGYCTRNYTEPQGRIHSTRSMTEVEHVCSTLITAPENHTISLYFIAVIPDYWDGTSFIEIFDGNDTNAQSLIKITAEYSNPIFSNSRYLLIRSYGPQDENPSASRMTYDLVYTTTDKGRGCGGKLMNIIGRLTSPLYPEVYRNVTSCEWELETPSTTRLMLRFEVFDMGVNCDQNYLQLINRNGDFISSYCLETPADYTSEDNYVKLVFVTTLNNGGTGWVADFVGII